MPGLEGRTLAGRYRVDEYIGGGGMGDVYKAWDTARSCYLAIKVMRQNLAEFQELAQRFDREAEALSRLQHPNIVRLYGLERDDDEDVAFIVMDYVDGPTLANKLKMAGGPLPLTEVVSMTEDVAAALSYAHNQAIYHRDIKPSNIIIARDGRAILADFGIARLSDALTMTYQGIGTPAYMSPEQCEGKEAGAASDIYSLGVVLYESLVGRRPFLGDLGRGEPPTTANIIREHVELPPPLPTDVNPSLRSQVEAVIMRTLAKDPEYRYQSAAELGRELRVAAGGAALPSLRVTSTPGGAKVYVDGELRGASPLDITRLPEGSHRVKVTATGYHEHEQVIELPEFRSLDISLEPLGGAAETIVVAPEVATGTREGGIPPRTPPSEAAGEGRRWWRHWWFRAALGLAGGGIVIGVLALLFMLSQGGEGDEGVAVVGSPTPTPTAAPIETPTPTPEEAVVTSTPSGEITYLMDLTTLNAKGLGLIGKAVRDDIPSIGGELFTRAIVMQTGNAGSQTFIAFDMAGDFQRFEAEVGLHDSASDLTVEFRVLGDGDELFVADRPLGPGDPALRVSVDISGVQQLTLFTLQRSGGCCLAEIIWGDPRVIQDQSESSAPITTGASTPSTPSKELTYLMDLTTLEAKGLGLIGKAVRDDIPSIGGELFTRAIVMQTGNAGSQTFIAFDMAGDFQRFEAEVGLHDSASDLTVEFRVLGDGVELFVTDRPLGPGDPALRVSVDISGVQQLTLFTIQKSGGCCLAEIIWGDARVIK